MSRGTHKLMREPQTSSGSAQGYTGLGFMLNLFHCCEIADVVFCVCVVQNIESTQIMRVGLQ